MEADWKAIRSTWPWRTASAQLKIPSVCQGRDTKDSSAHGGNSLTFLEWLVNWFIQAESHYSLPESKTLHTNISLCFRGALFHKKVTLEKEYIPYETTTSRQHLKVWNNDVSMKLLRSNQNGKDQSGANQPSVDWGGGVTGGQKDEWAWLVGWEPPGLSMLGEKPGHSAERESRKEGQEMRTRSNPERQNCVKKIYPPPALLQERNPHPSSCSRGQVRQGYVAVCPFLLWHATCVYNTTFQSCSFRNSPRWSGHHAGSAGEVTCPELATAVLVGLMTSWFATHFTSISLFPSYCKLFIQPLFSICSL